MATLSWKNPKFEDIIFGQFMQNKTGTGYTVPLSIKDKDGKVSRIRIQTARSRLPFGGCSEFVDKDTGKVSRTVNFSLDPQLKEFADFLAKLDDVCIKAGEKNFSKWFAGNKKLSPGMIGAMWQDSAKAPKDETKGYSPTLKAKILFRNDQIVTKYYDGDAKVKRGEDPPLLSSEQVTGGYEGVALLEISGIWFVAGKWGLTYTATQIKCYANDSVGGFAIKTESDDEREDDSADEGGIAIQESDDEDLPPSKKQKIDN